MATPTLSGAQRRHLRGLAHPLEPVVQVGQRGLRDEVVTEVDRALDAHELIKVRLSGDREEKAGQAAELTERLSCQLVGQVGHVAILFRPHPDEERRRVRLPAATGSAS